ncbi:uncharacterized protein G2W53_007634 [Senna tora]|uniref:Uncharacterized protein n=1 Tax=Senna tora TaxID=362788 RepID=A0A834X6M3_9FABA|nr:uncharacterized protein G2W53_007634 [Senna tora]
MTPNLITQFLKLKTEILQAKTPKTHLQQNDLRENQKWRERVGVRV